MKSNYTKWDTVRMAITLAAYLTLGGVWLGLALHNRSHHYGSKPKVAHTYFQNRLADQYEHFNDGWFGGELPKNVKIGLTNDPNLIGRTDMYANGDFVIIENPLYNKTTSQADLTLLHEMCHVRTWGEPSLTHGPKWVGCMRNLAKEGAFDNLW